MAYLGHPLLAQNPHLNLEYETEYDLSSVLPGLPEDKLAIFNNIVGVYSYSFCNNYSEFKKTGNRKKNPTISEGSLTSSDIVDYKDFNNKLQYRQHKGKPELVSREELHFDYLWQIDTERTNTILGYTCNRAVLSQGEQEITAWFAPDIPIPDGPMGYYGLPGLILQIELPILTIKAVNLQENAIELEIKMPEADTYLSSEEFNRRTRSN